MTFDPNRLGDKGRGLNALKALTPLTDLHDHTPPRPRDELGRFRKLNADDSLARVKKMRAEATARALQHGKQGVGIDPWKKGQKTGLEAEADKLKDFI